MKYKYLLSIFALSILAFSAQAQIIKIKTIAGTGIGGFSNDGFAATNAELNAPISVAQDAAGNVFVVDFTNRRVRRISTTGIISTYAGNGGGGNTGDSSLATSAQVYPQAIATDKYGNLYIADGINAVVRKVDVTTQFIYTVAGNGLHGYTGFGVPATSASFQGPRGIAVDTSGNIFIADAPNNVVRRVDAVTGIITTVAGNDTVGYLGDNGAAIHARLDSPLAVATDRRGNLYITDYKNNVIRKVDTNGIITTVVGTVNTYGSSGDGGLATLALLNKPAGLACDTNSNLYIADVNNDEIRKVTVATGKITTVVGNGSQGFGGDLGQATGCQLFSPFGVTVDIYGNITIADANNERVRQTYSSVGVANVAQNADLQVYPNPFNDLISINGLTRSDKVCLYDVVGRQVTGLLEATGAGSQEFEIKGLAAGTYMLQVVDADGNKKACTRLVKSAQ